MTTDAEIAARLDAAIGVGPDQRPLDPVLHAGHRRVLARRVGIGVAAAVAVVATGFAVTGGGEGSRADDVPPAATPGSPSAPPAPTEPTAAPPRIPAPRDFEGQLAVVTLDGEVFVNPRATLSRRLTVRYDGEVAHLFAGRLRGRTLYQFSAGDGGMSAFDDEAPGRGSLRAWGTPILRTYVEANRPGATAPDPDPGIEVPPPAPPGLVAFRDGRLVPAPGVEVTDEVAGVQLRDFAEPGQPTAAARVTRGDAVYFLVARPDDVITVEPPPGVETLRQWLRFARAAYEAGVGLR